MLCVCQAQGSIFTSGTLSIAILCLSQSHRIKRDKVFCGWLCDSSNPPFGRNSLCRGFTIYAKHISVNWFAGRTFVIRSLISSPLLTFTYRDFKLRLLSRLRISHNTQRPCYETITVFDFCGTNCFGEESNLTKIWMNNPNRAEYAVDTEVSWSLSRSLVVTYTTTKQHPSYVCNDCAGDLQFILCRLTQDHLIQSLTPPDGHAPPLTESS